MSYVIANWRPIHDDSQLPEAYRRTTSYSLATIHRANPKYLCRSFFLGTA